MREARHTVVMAVLAILSAATAAAQIDTGTITGRVVDPTGAVVANAQVTVTQTEMNFESITQTNAEGIYRVQSLRPGPYRITVVASGFKRLVRENVELRVADTVAVNATLEVGALTESIQVTGAAPLLETETSATGHVMEGNYFYRLPLFQRYSKIVLWLTPGLTYSGFAYGQDLSNVHLNGLRSGSIGYFEDGVLATIGDGSSADTIMNSIEEIKVITTVMPAEYGHSASGAIVVVKKSGTNQLHGLVSEFGRTRAMQHRKFWDMYKYSQPRPGLPNGAGVLFQQPDANLNGPVYIPKIYDGRNRTFFMFGWSRLTERMGRGVAPYTVPNDDMKNGNFTFGGIGNPIYDPRTTRQLANGDWIRDPFPGNIIPKAQWDPVAAKIVSMNPWAPPNAPGSIGTGGPADNLIVLQPTWAARPVFTVRIDHQFKPSFKLYGTWTGDAMRQWSSNPPVQNPVLDNSLNYQHFSQNTASIGTTVIISPTLISDTRIGYYRKNATNPSFAYKQDYAKMLGIPNLPPDTMPRGISYGLDVASPSIDIQETMTLKSDLTKVKGTHALKMGYELMRPRGNNWSVGNPSGNFSLAGTNGLRTNGTGLPNSGNNFATFLVGSVASASFDRPLMSFLPRTWMHSAYVQDDWKLSPTLTLNLGVRYSVEGPARLKYGQISVWDPTAQDDSIYTNWTCPAGGCVGAWTHPKGGAAYNRDWNNFQPRIGLAWHPTDKLVVRSGFALSTIDQRFLYTRTDELTSESTSQQRAAGDPRPLYQISSGPDPIVYPTRRADGSVYFRGNPGGHGAEVLNPNVHNPYTMTWNLGLQYELHRDYVLETTYTGSSAVGLTGSSEQNTLPWGYLANDPAARDRWVPVAQYSRPWPGWGTVNYTSNFYGTTYHAGTVKIEKRYSRGLNFLAFYTYSKTLENGVGNKYLDWHLLKGRASFDQRQRFASSMTYEIPIGKGRKLMNRGGWLNVLFGGYDFVWTYTISSGSPLGMSITGQNTQNYPGWMPGYGNVILQRVPELRDGWTDIGADRWNTANQNSMISCGKATATGNDCFTYTPSYSIGTNGKYLWDKQRIISANISASKEVPIKERLRFEFRWDFQNPFHWYNWNGPNTTLDLRNPQYFGSVSGEMSTANEGGQPMMHLTLAFKW